MKRRLLVALIISVFMLPGCGNSSEEPKSNETAQRAEETKDQEKSNDELSQSEWMEQNAGKMEDGYEVVDVINIDSVDTKLEYKSSEKFIRENGEEVILANFTFSNVSAGTTSLDAQYNFQAFQDGVEIGVYPTLLDEVEGDENRHKEILNGSSIEVSVGIAPENFESPIKLRVNDVMAYDDIENMGHTFQQQEIQIGE